MILWWVSSELGPQEGQAVPNYENCAQSFSYYDNLYNKYCLVFYKLVYFAVCSGFYYYF